MKLLLVTLLKSNDVKEIEKAIEKLKLQEKKD